MILCKYREKAKITFKKVGHITILNVIIITFKQILLDKAFRLFD